MPYRIDLSNPSSTAFDRLVELGALDIESIDGGLAAILPDSLSAEELRRELSSDQISFSPAVGRDNDSVWVLSPRPIHAAGGLRLRDSNAFGTGLHPTTALCLETLGELLDPAVPERVLDVGTGSGILALAALIKGVPQATGVDTDPEAIVAAAENARLNNLSDRIHLLSGDTSVLTGSWPLVFANILAAPLMEMAPAIVRRVGHHGRLVLSGIPQSTEEQVARCYQHLGMRLLQSTTRSGWVALTLTATW